MRTVARPDLLLIGALLHDIGKGYPGDHTEVGMELVGTIVPRMGFDDDDTAIVRSLVEHHLLLSETALRRDLADPRTAENVAAAVGDQTRLELLRALTEADSRATGPSAWSAWKETLLDELTAAVAAVLAGHEAVADDIDHEVVHASILGRVRTDQTAHTARVQTDDFELWTV
ncbi:MAG TPA: HD domain-containing protein, partial [Ilumatobacteraceae bacterium]|nr:HD domain-containing protein [Ilumatobacteraceae bacterium]